MTKIYLVENCYNDPNKVYIGKTINSRFNSHRRTYGTNIIYTVIDQINSLDRKEWKYLECYWIEQFRQWGFNIMNINKKGGGGPEFYPEEIRVRMRKKRKLGTGLKISKTLLSNNHSQYYTQEVKEKISKALKGHSRVFSDKHLYNLKLGKSRQAKKIIQFSIDGVFIKTWNSRRDASEYIKLLTNKTSNITSQIKDCCLGRQKTAFGFKWKNTL